MGVCVWGGGGAERDLGVGERERERGIWSGGGGRCRETEMFSLCLMYRFSCAVHPRLNHRHLTFPGPRNTQ